MSAPKRGKWAQAGDMKGRIKAFKFKAKLCVVESVLVTHAYDWKQLQLDYKPVGNVNYLYPTKWEDWQDPSCILDVIVVIHAEVGESMKGARTHKQLLDVGVFFYDAIYTPPAKQGKFGKLTALPLPPLDSRSWPVPDIHSSEAFWHRLYSDFQAAMKPSTGGRVCTLRWYMPLHIMVELFSTQCHIGMHKTNTLYVFKPTSKALIASIMDDGWDKKIVAGKDVIRCQVLRESVSFRYHTGRSMLYSTFGYVRDRLLHGEWMTMDQASQVEMLNIEVHLLDGTAMSFQLGKNWTLDYLREEIGFHMSDDTDLGWTLSIVAGASATKAKKVNRRQEAKTLMDDIEYGSSLHLHPLKEKMKGNLGNTKAERQSGQCS